MAVRYVFCINAGRCGSNYLTALLRCAKGAASVHEGLPVMNGAPMQAFNQGDEQPLADLMPLKWAEIQKALRRRRVYCETNHSFIKGWGWLVPDQWARQEEIGVIILRRDSEQIADSLLRLHDVPGASDFSRAWYLTPGSKRDLSAPPVGADAFQLCKWYAEETYLRAEAYQKQFPKMIYHACELTDLNQQDGVMRLFDRFGLEPTRALKQVIGEPMNTRDIWPRYPRERLLTLPLYPNPDDWPADRRDELIAKVLSWIESQHAKQTRGMQRDASLLGTYATAAIAVILRLQEAIEETFQVRLSFTETQRILACELVYRSDPRDVSFLFITRQKPPGLRFVYEFNRVVNLPGIYQTLGGVGLLRSLWHIAKSRWRGESLV